MNPGTPSQLTLPLLWQDQPWGWVSQLDEARRHPPRALPKPVPPPAGRSIKAPAEQMEGLSVVFRLAPEPIRASGQRPPGTTSRTGRPRVRGPETRSVSWTGSPSEFFGSTNTRSHQLRLKEPACWNGGRALLWLPGARPDKAGFAEQK